MVATDPVIPESRFPIPLPRPLWITLAAAVLVVVAVALRIGVPIYRQHVAARSFERVDGPYHIGKRKVGASWLRNLIGEERTQDWFDEVIWIGFTRERITDAEMANLPFLTNLEDLMICDSPITDAGLQHLEPLTGLQSLVLSGTGVSDRGLRHLRNLTRLEFLNLSDTRITDQGLEYLHGLTNLDEIWIHGTDVTDAGVERLKWAIPRTTILTSWKRYK